jgi:glycosyltransferase involved in cell wall biosynthesis
VPYNIRIVSTYPPRRCGIGTFSRDLATALEHLTSEVGHIRVAAIDNGNGPYGIPVDLVIDQYNLESWANTTKHIITRAGESANPTVVILQHEYGLDPDSNGNDGQGTNFINMAKTFRERGFTTLCYLHTVLNEPDLYQKRTLLELSRLTDGLIVTTESAIHILESDKYGIEHVKLKHIDHGIRMQHPSQFDRLAIKHEYGIEDHLLIVTMGLLSPDKGVQYSIRAYGKFLAESCTEAQREKVVYLIAGQPHPEFVKAEGGLPYREYQVLLDESLRAAGVRWCRTRDLHTVDFNRNDIVFFDSFLDENTFLRLYSAANIILLPYLNMQQISSGILADSVGAGRVAVTTKFVYALELIHSNKKCQPGLIIGRFARGILVDPGEPSVEQIAKAIDYLTFNKEKRLMMEKQAHERGYQMRWDNSAWALLQYIDFVREQKEIVTGRGVKFAREKPSALQVKRRQTV